MVVSSIGNRTVSLLLPERVAVAVETQVENEELGEEEEEVKKRGGHKD